MMKAGPKGDGRGKMTWVGRDEMPEEGTGLEKTSALNRWECLPKNLVFSVANSKP
jgi:hypothetical protein